MIVLGVDPGQTTGWALLEHPMRLVGSGQVEAEGRDISSLLSGLGPEDELVIERFRLRPTKGRALGGDDLVAAQVVGALKDAAESTLVPVVEQEPAIKAVMPVGLLSALGVLPRGRHARDACRHAAYRLLHGHGSKDDPYVQARLASYLSA